jgi:hypothetical protein
LKVNIVTDFYEPENNEDFKMFEEKLFSVSMMSTLGREIFFYPIRMIYKG